jgi:ASC-1-like (ASCH) protein
MEHHLKIQPVHFEAVCSGLKLAELRKNDRDFKAGDILQLHEWNGKYTCRYVSRIAIHVADVSDYLPGYVLISMCGNFKQEPTKP